MEAYYNEYEPFVVKWLQGLSAAGRIAPGRVDERSIAAVRPEDIGYGQAHFFCGIGGWPHALDLAGWPRDLPVWTGSCPCQPFSSAGRGAGTSDERHLWPVWFELIKKCRPSVVFGEQVSSPGGLEWLDVVQADFQREGYTFGVSDLCSAGVKAPHLRQRLYFTAFADGERLERVRLHLRERRSQQDLLEAARRGETGELGDTRSAGSGRDRGAVPGPQGEGERERLELGSVADEPQLASAAGFWDGADWIYCTDGKYRPVEPGTSPLAARIPGRVGLIRGYGNAITVQVAAEWIRWAMEYLER